MRYIVLHSPVYFDIFFSRVASVLCAVTQISLYFTRTTRKKEWAQLDEKVPVNHLLAEGHDLRDTKTEKDLGHYHNSFVSSGCIFGTFFVMFPVRTPGNINTQEQDRHSPPHDIHSSSGLIDRKEITALKLSSSVLLQSRSEQAKFWV